MTFAPITKLKKFTGEENNTQTWINNITKDDTRTIQVIPYFLKDTADSWYHSLAQKSQNFNAFKTEFLRYFSNNNSINRLASTFTILKQRDTETVTTYLKYFYRNLHQIQAIQADYFTAPQILNQFIRGLHSSILQRVRLMHSVNLSIAVTHARDFEAAELEANHVQAVNLVMNRSSDLDSKLKQFRKCESFPKLVASIIINKSAMATKNANLPQLANCYAYIPNSELLLESKSISIYLPANNTTANLSNTGISTSNISTAATHNILTTATNSLSTTTINSNTVTKPSYDNIQKFQIQSNSKLKIGNGGSPTNPQFNKLTIRIMSMEFRNWNYLSLLIAPEDAAFSKQKTNQKPLTCNIPLAASTENKLLAAIFLFKLEEIMSVSLFSRAALNTKPITAMYTDAKVDGQYIKLILDSGLAGSIITKQLMDQLGCQVDKAVSARIITADGATKTSIGEIDNFPFEVNGIIVPIKVLTINTPAPLIKFKEEEKKPTWKAYQVLWADNNHNELLPILLWDNNTKEKQREKLTWETDDLNWTDNNKNKPIPSWKWKKNSKEKRKVKEEELLSTNNYTLHKYTLPQSTNYH
ncbi:hypothetical protein G9A89_016714 [Geosiphon pyriformis]|nr:hypothetical protein G9A89_016714 [Geosiphon pyriformis]